MRADTHAVTTFSANPPGGKPGWYIDRRDPTCERYFDGFDWTDRLRNAPVLEDFLGPIEPILARILGDEVLDSSLEEIIPLNER